MYKTDINRARSLINETKVVFRVMNENFNVDQLKKLILNDNILAISADSTRQAVFRSIKKRFFFNNKVDLNLKKFFKSPLISDYAKNILLFYKLAKADELVYDITTNLLYDRMKTLEQTINTNEIQDFFKSKEIEHPEILKWSVNTKIRLARHYLAIMKDFKYLRGSRIKILNKPEIPIEIIIFMILNLKERNYSLEKTLNHEEFKLFILEEDEIIDLLSITFRNNLLVFNLNCDSIQELYDNYNLESFINEL